MELLNLLCVFPVGTINNGVIETVGVTNNYGVIFTVWALNTVGIIINVGSY